MSRTNEQKRWFRYVGTQEEADEYADPKPEVGKIYCEDEVIGVKNLRVIEFAEGFFRSEWQEVNHLGEEYMVGANTISVIGEVDGEPIQKFATQESFVFGIKVSETLSKINKMLIEKNRKYGNSALEPLRVFSSASPLEQLKVRIDDKLSRVKTGELDEDEDVVNDLIGYLVLYKIAKQDGKV